MHRGVMQWGGNVGGSSRSGLIVTTRHNRDGWYRFVFGCQFARDLGNIYVCVMVWDLTFSGSSVTGVL